MEGQALVSQKEYSTVKTMYVLAIFFCVVAFLYPLTMISDAFNYGSDTAISYAIWAYPLALLSDFTTFFLLFCMLLAKGTARKTLMLIAMLIYFLVPLIYTVINDIIYYTQVYSLADASPQLAYGQVLGFNANSNPLITSGMVIGWLKDCLNIFIAVLLYRRYKERIFKPAATNFLFALIAAWVGYIIFEHVWFLMQNAPKTLFMPWVLYIVAVALLGWIVFQKTRKAQKKYMPLLSAFFILYIAVYYIVIELVMPYSDAYVTFMDVGLRIISLMYTLLPVYVLVFAYKTVSDYGFYPLFIESNPRGIIRAKQYAPGEDSVWSQFVSLIRRALWKNN